MSFRLFIRNFLLQCLSQSSTIIMQVHSELSADLDHNHEKALNRLLKDCTDEQLISELARRKVDIQVSLTTPHLINSPCIFA